MDFGVIAGFISIILVLVVGIIVIIKCNKILKKIDNAENLPAIITGYVNDREEGNQSFICTVKISEDKVVKCRRRLRVKFFEKASKYIGKEIMVPYDRELDKVLEDERIVRSYLHISIFLVIFFGLLALCFLIFLICI